MKKYGINQAKYCYIKTIGDRFFFIDNKLNQIEFISKDIFNKIESILTYPMFVKPSNSGSSIGISKVNDKIQLIAAIEKAKKFDNEILIEEEIIGRELECAVLGNEDVIASCVGEIITFDDFYDYSAKYEKNTSILSIPADIPQEKRIQELSIKAFRAINGTGLSRVDFFFTDNGKIYINEINTMPGFTNISMYAKLWERSGIAYSNLIEKLIELAV